MANWMAGLWQRELEKMKTEGLEKEMEGFDRIFHFVEFSSVREHCVPWLPLGYLDTCAQIEAHSNARHV